MTIWKTLGRFVLIAAGLFATWTSTRNVQDENIPPKVADFQDKVRALGRFVGDWESSLVYIDPDTGAKETGRGLLTIEYALSGHFIQYKLQAAFPGGGRHKTKGYITYDQSAGAYRSFMFSNEGGIEIGTLTTDEDQKVWTTVYAETDARTGDRAEGKAVLTFVEDDRTEWTAWRKKKSDKDFKKMMTGVDTRRR